MQWRSGPADEPEKRFAHSLARRLGACIGELRFMRHYEIVLIIHPDQSEQVPAMVERYKTMIEAQKGRIHRLEDWGRRQLAYPVGKMSKAHYVLLNIEANPQTIAELENGLRFNDAVLRHMTIGMKKAFNGASPMLRHIQREESRRPVGESGGYPHPGGGRESGSREGGSREGSSREGGGREGGGDRREYGTGHHSPSGHAPSGSQAPSPLSVA